VLTLLLFIALLAGFLWVYFQVYLPLQRVKELTAYILEKRSTSGFVQSGQWGIDGVIRNLRDIDEEVKQLRLQVEQEGQGLEALFSRMVEAVAIMNGQGEVKIANRPFCDLFGVEGEAKGRRFNDICRDMEIRQAGDLALIEEKTGVREIILEEAPGKIKDLKVIQVSYAPLQLGGEKKSGAIMIIYDVSRLRQLEQIRTDFVANLSHELRTPLSIFKGYLETLITDEEMKRKDQQRMLKVVGRHSERLTLLVEDLLTLSRLESSGDEQELDWVVIPKFLKRVAEDCRQLFVKRQMKIEVYCSKEVPDVLMDSIRMEQVFYNLVDNALRYSGDSEKVEIRVQHDEEKDEVLFSVKDYGPGIPSDKLGHIFERFYRVDRGRARNMGGTGLGLSIVKHIIQSHGGQVWADSELGQGTAINFTIPLHGEWYDNEEMVDRAETPSGSQVS